jgi:hypothetical protein
VQHQRFGGDEFSFRRMSWIKPNFLWMMYRSGWATKAGQEVVLALRLRRAYFDGLLAAAVESSWQREIFPERADWQVELRSSAVRLQWDPDHDPSGAPVERRALQLGLRGSALAAFRTDSIVSIEDITPFVREQHANARDARLLVPSEEVYPVDDASVRRRLRLSDAQEPP